MVRMFVNGTLLHATRIATVASPRIAYDVVMGSCGRSRPASAAARFTGSVAHLRLFAQSLRPEQVGAGNLQGMLGVF